MPENVFVYGTLMYAPVLHALLQRIPSQSKAVIKGFKRYNIRGQVFPGVIQSTPDSQVSLGFIAIIGTHKRVPPTSSYSPPPPLQNKTNRSKDFSLKN